MSVTECQRLRPYLLDFVVGELDPAEAQKLQLESHLAACVDCRAAVEELRGTGRALEAVKAFDSQLTEQVRRDISSRAKLEAEKLRQARQLGRQGGAPRSVPAHAWAILVLGAVAVLAGIALVPKLTPGHPARLKGASGDKFAPEYAPGAQIKVPAGALMHLELADGSNLKLRGLAEVTLAKGNAPLSLARGAAWLAAGATPLAVNVETLDKLELGARAQAALEIRPAEDEPACIAVLSGTVTYAARSGPVTVTQGQTLTVKQPSGAATVRPSKATETAPWHTSLPGNGPDSK